MPSKFKSTFLILLLIVLVAHSFEFAASNPQRYWMDFKHPVKFGSLTVEDGLSQSSVLCILQDSRGFMWFGTEDGLNRYDGFRFKPFRPEPGNPYSLNHNVIFSLFEDSKGKLWVGTNGAGINIFDPVTERFSHYSFVSGKDGNYAIDNIYCIAEDSSGIIWAGTEGGLLRCDPKQMEFQRFRHDLNDPTSINSNTINGIFEDNQGTMWFSTDGGLNRLQQADRATSKKLSFSHFLTVPGKSGDTYDLNKVMAVCQHQNGTLWIGTQNGLFSLNQKTGTYTGYPELPGDSGGLSHHYVRTIYKDRAGVIWIGTDGGGLNKLVPGKTAEEPPSFIQYQFDSSNPDSINGNGIQSIFEDHTGVLWVGVYQGGVNRLVLGSDDTVNRERTQFIHYKVIPNVKNSLSHNLVSAISEGDHGEVWVGTDGGGLNRIIAPKNNMDPLKFVHYRHDPKNPRSLSDDIVTCLLRDKKGTIWIGTYTGGLDKLVPGNNMETPAFIHYQATGAPGSLAGNFVLSIAEDRQGNLWVGTIQGGLHRFNPGSETFTRFRNDPRDHNSISDNNVFSIYQDRSGTLWVGTPAGLNQKLPQDENKKNKDKAKFIRYFNDPNNPTTLGSNFVRVIYQDRTGILWVGTNGGGLNRFIPADNPGEPGSFTSYRQEDGLPGNVIVGILEDESGNLWLSTTKGLANFNPKTGTSRLYDMRDGLQGNEFNRGAFYKCKSGEMFFGGNKGFNIFHPLEIQENLQVPTMVITDFQLFNHSVRPGESIDDRILLTKSITATQNLELSYRDYIFSFNFAALHYLNPSKNQYAYIMEGLESKWNYVGNRRFATYTTLPHGDYVFRVKGSNNDGTWNEVGVSIRITITPPFYKTWWFYSIAALLAILTAYGIHLYRVHKIITKIKKKYEKTAISPKKSDAYLKTLLNYMKIAKPYLDSQLTLRSLAKKVAIPHHNLSQVINDRLKKIFFDFVNQYRIEEALKKLSDPKERQKTIQQVATEVGFNSQSAFNRAFKKHTETTPFEFINQCRINEAEQKLTDPQQKKKSIGQIADEVGFSSLSSFNRAFKKISGKTPTQFRKESVKH